MGSPEQHDTTHGGSWGGGGGVHGDPSGPMGYHINLNSAILVTDISDHLHVFCFITSQNIKLKSFKPLIIERRQINEKVTNQIQTMIEQTNWNYLDDMNINDACEASTINELEDSLKYVKTWMDGNRLKMNDSKTEFIQFGSKQQLKKCVAQNLVVNNCEIGKAHVIKYLGVYLDENITMKTHIKQKCRAAMANYYRIVNIRRYLTVDACKQFVHGLIISHIGYSNSLYYGLPKCDIQKLQRIQSIAAKMILRRRKYDSVTACLKELHWLPVALRIEFKILTVVWKCLNDQAPQYLIELLHIGSNVRSLRSSVQKQLVIPRDKCKTFGDRSFSVSGPRLWNNIPMDIRSSTTLDIFKSKLKTFLFSKF